MTAARTNASEPCVVYLIWSGLRDAYAQAEAFLEAYASNPGCISHRLLVVFNGFSEEAQLSRYRSAFSKVEYSSLRLSQSAQDIEAYLRAAQTVPSTFLC